MNPDSWQGRPYYSIGQFLRERFGEKVYKIPVSVAQTCPNREGLRGMQTCNFCDASGSAAYPDLRPLGLRDQITESRRRVQERARAARFLIYFQAYTNTFAKTAWLREQLEVAAEMPDVVGFVIGTRPDCVSDAVLELWNDWARTHFLAVELGVQSFDENQLLWMRRGHTARQAIQTVHRVARVCPSINLGIHLILGNKGETDADVIHAAQTASALPIHNVKLHNMHVLRNTPLEQEYLSGEFHPLSRPEYARRVALFLQNLRPDIAVHRLAAVASDFDMLIAPDWVRKRMENYQFIISEMAAQGAYQGQTAAVTRLRPFCFD